MFLMCGSDLSLQRSAIEPAFPPSIPLDKIERLIQEKALARAKGGSSLSAFKKLLGKHKVLDVNIFDQVLRSMQV
jgi:hypothetical protein